MEDFYINSQEYEYNGAFEEYEDYADYINVVKAVKIV